MFIQEGFETVLIPACVGLLSLNDKRRVGPDSMTKRLIDSYERLNIDELDDHPMFIKMGQFPDPVGKVQILFFQIRGILLRLFLMELSINARLPEQDFAVSAMVKVG
jgi:hypothetical protein